MSRLHAKRAPEPKASPSRPTRPRPSLPVVAMYSFKPSPPFPVHLSVRDERKQRRELLCGKAPQAGRHTKFSIVIDGTQVRARHLTHSLLCGSCCVGVWPGDRIDCNWQRILAFGNAVILLLILFILFGWRELLGEFGKKRSATK